MFIPPSFNLIESRSVTFKSTICLENLKLWLQSFSQAQFTGRLTIKIVDHQQWSLYFCQGCLMGGTSAIHPMRRWYRQIWQHCPQLLAHSDSSPNRQKYWDYSTLEALVYQEKISRPQLTAIVEGNLREILFDMCQGAEQTSQSRLGEVQLTYGSVPRHVDPTALVAVQPRPILEQAIEAWQTWKQAGLSSYSPNWAPVIWNLEELRRQSSAMAYHTFVTLVNGDRTFRDLAACLKQPVMQVVKTILPHLQNTTMKLIEIGDLTVETTFKAVSPQQKAVSPQQPLQTQPSNHLIIYIEDSLLDRVAMSRILAQAGYQFTNIRDPVQALPILLEQKPSLIFLDLLMPVTNGYEICAHIRRISALKDIPVVIVTSNDGIVDRTRAKLAGASDFIAKPIDAGKILAVLQRHLPVPPRRPSNHLKPEPVTISNIPN